MTRKERIKVAFADFWPNFIKNDNYFYHLLNQEFEVIIDEKKPDLLFHSVDYSNKREHEKSPQNDTRWNF